MTKKKTKPKPSRLDELKKVWEAKFPNREFAPTTFDNTLCELRTSRFLLEKLERIWENNAGPHGGYLNVCSLQALFDRYKVLVEKEQPAKPDVRLLPTEITDCRDCHAIACHPVHGAIVCAHARRGGYPGRSDFALLQPDNQGNYVPLHDCPLKKKGE
jgi:hypothetical protein